MAGSFLDDDLAAMFGCEEFAEPAVYRPLGGASRRVKLIRDRPAEDFGLGGGGVTAEAVTAQMRSCDLPAAGWQDGDRCELAGIVYAVVQAKKDLSGDVVVLSLNRAA
jgi:hypothetical protein